LPQKLATAVSQHTQELDIVLLEERQHTVIEQIGRSALGHDGLWIFANWILTDRILANRGLANRRRRRRRLLARQIGGGGSAQHGQGCSRYGYNFQHHQSSLVWTVSPAKL
jgi:hypothetical protein